MPTQGFDPDQYLSEKVASSGFNPDRYLAEKTGAPTSSPLVAGVRNFVQGATGNLSDELAGVVEGAGRAAGVNGLGGPMKDISVNPEGPTLDTDKLKQAYLLGRDHERAALATDAKERPALSTTANIAGAVASPLNKLVAGMSLPKAGAVLGAVNGFGSSDADSATGLAADTATGGALGGAFGYGAGKLGQAAGKGMQKLANAISPAEGKLNVDEIRAAAQRLGIKVTPGMLDNTGFVERMESGLAKSPSYLGQRVLRNQKAVVDGLSQTAEDLTSDATNLSPYQLGEKFKSGVTSSVGERLDPLSAVFDQVRESTQNIPVSDRSKAAVIRNIQNLDNYSLTNGAGKPAQYVDMIGRLKNADQVKTMMTMLNDDIRASEGSERSVLLGIKDKLGLLEKNSIMRGAIESARTPGEAAQAGTDIIGDLKDARAGYRNLSQDLSGVAGDARIKASNPTSFLDAIEQVPSERVQDKFFNVENERQLANLQKTFPDEYNLLRLGKLKEIQDAAVDHTVNGQGRTSAARFLKAVGDLNPEAQGRLFPGKTGTVSDLSTIQKSLPRNFNPSGTASEQSWEKMLLSNATDIPKYALYKAASTNLAKDVAGRLAQTPNIAALAEKNPQAFQGIVNQIEQSLSPSVPRAIQKSKVANDGDTDVAQGPRLKGENKWTVDGYANAVQHDGTLSDPKVAERLFASQAGRNLLLSASDLKPGSKAMAKVVSQIKNRLNKGDR